MNAKSTYRTRLEFTRPSVSRNKSVLYVDCGRPHIKYHCLSSRNSTIIGNSFLKSEPSIAVKRDQFSNTHTHTYTHTCTLRNVKINEYYHEYQKYDADTTKQTCLASITRVNCGRQIRAVVEMFFYDFRRDSL